MSSIYFQAKTNYYLIIVANQYSVTLSQMNQNIRTSLNLKCVSINIFDMDTCDLTYY